MWIVELAFSSAPERLAARPAHRDRLTDLYRAGIVRMAGPLADGTGAVIILDVADLAGVDRVIADDPYFTTPGVTIRHTRQWEPFLR